MDLRITESGPDRMADADKPASAVGMAREEFCGRVYHDVNAFPKASADPHFSTLRRPAKASQYPSSEIQTKGEWLADHWRHHGAVHADENPMP